MVDFLIDDLFMIKFCVFDGVGKSPADSAAGSRINESVLRAGVECVFAVDEFRVKHDIALLRRGGDEVVEPFPVFQVLCPHDSAGGDGGGFITFFGGGVFALGAEQTVNPAVFVPGQTHIVNVGVPFGSFGQKDRFFPETETVHAGNGIRDSEE